MVLSTQTLGIQNAMLIWRKFLFRVWKDVSMQDFSPMHIILFEESFKQSCRLKKEIK